MCWQEEPTTRSQRPTTASLSVILPRGFHPFPSRTRKLSPAGPMVLHAKVCGSVGRRRHKNKSHAEKSGWLLLFGSLAQIPSAYMLESSSVGGEVADVRVTCITKPNVFSSHEHITQIGGAGWKWDRDAVIQSIENKTNTFYVVDSSTGIKAYVGVIKPTDGRSPYLRTYADGKWNDNLLSLPQCP